jgi:hypothetical protein
MNDDFPRLAAEAPTEVVDAAAPLPGSELLSQDEASQLLARSPGRVVVWMGDSGGGKTTLTMRLYERQRLAPDAVRFAGSATLLAFEALAYQRHLGAGDSTAGAKQAPIGSDERQIFHLALSDGAELVNLLLADLPGALFRALADNRLALSAIPLAQRSDKLALIVDGGRLRDRNERASVLTCTRQLLERLATASLTQNGTELALVVTKWDLVAEDPDTLAYWQAREHQVADDVRELDASAPHIRVAAGAPPSFPMDDGVGALRTWLLGAPGATALDPPVEPFAWPSDAPERMRRSRRRGGR